MTSEKLTVMGPAVLSSSSRGGSSSHDHPPTFTTNFTVKSKYRDELRRWIEMLNMFAEVDTKSRAMLNGAGPLIYRSCDDFAQQMIQSAEKSGIVCMKGNRNDPNREALVEQIINIIAKDSPTELMRMEVELLNDIQTCVRRAGESPHLFANRYSGTVARYVNQTSEMTDLTSRQFAVTLLRNAKLTPDTLNSLMFQLTSKTDNKKTTTKVLKLHIRIGEASMLSNFIAAHCGEGVEHRQELLKISDRISQLSKRSETECNVSIISMEDTVQSLSQVKIITDEIRDASSRGSMLGKRSYENEAYPRTERIKKLKSETKCKGCGEIGHWYRDRPNCIQKVQRNIENKKDESTRDTWRGPDQNTEFKDKKIGAPTSTGGVVNVTQLCDALAIPLILKPPREQYDHGWGHACADAKPIRYSWDLFINDVNRKPTVMTFDLVEGSSPLIIGLDVKRFSDTMNRQKPTFVIFQRPCDTEERKFFTYIRKDDGGNERIRFDILPHGKSTVSSLLGAVSPRQEINMVKKVHRFTHASSNEMRRLFDDAKMTTAGVIQACEKVSQACDICASSGRPTDMKKVSLSHVNEAFNQEIQADFVIVYIGDKKLEVLNVVDVGTRYGERVIAENRSAQNMMVMLEAEWLYHHGAPQSFSADPEFCKPVLEKFLSTHKIKLKPRPSRSSSKNGHVERNNGVFKMVLSRLAKESTSASHSTMVSRASFMTNMFHGNATLSAFQLARGYAPSILGMPSNAVSQGLLDAHTEAVAIRAIQRVVRSKVRNVEPHTSFAKGMRVWVYFKTSKQNERPRWIEARVINATPHMLKCRRSKRGPPMTVAYEHVRIAPRGELSRELMKRSLEDELAQESADKLGKTFGAENDSQSLEDTKEDENKEPENTEQGESTTLMQEIFGDEDENESEERGEILNMQRSSFFTQRVCGDPRKDIGEVSTKSKPGNGVELVSQEQEALNELHKIIGSEQVTRKRMECAPPWLVAKAVKTELDSNWDCAYAEMREEDVSRRANVIGSHVVYKIKVEENGVKRLKARLCPHGNHDNEKGQIRKDSATAQFDVIRLLCSLATVLGLRLGCLDVKGAYLQSAPIQREIFVRPPYEWKGPRGVIWKLLKMPYGIPEAGRQWAKVFEQWLTQEAKFERVQGVPQLFTRKHEDGKFQLLLAKVTDDLLIAGSVENIGLFTAHIKERFPISKAVIDDSIKFNGSDIMQDKTGSVVLSMETYMHSISPILLNETRRRERGSMATEKEVNWFRSMAGELVWLGCGALPQAAYVGSYMQQCIPRLKVEHMMQANGMLKELKDLKALVKFKAPQRHPIDATVNSFSDAAFNISKTKQYGQTGFILGILYECEVTKDKMYHMVDWASTKQRRVCHSSYGAEILACSDADDRGYNLKLALNSLFPRDTFKHVLNVDSKGLYDTITTLHEGRDYRLRQTVQRLRDSFEAGEVNVIRWIQGKANIADALTKRNPISFRMLNRIASSGIMELPAHNSFEVDNETWV